MLLEIIYGIIVVISMLFVILISLIILPILVIFGPISIIADKIASTTIEIHSKICDSIIKFLNDMKGEE